MSITLTESHGGKLLTVKATDKLTAEDYHQFVPAVERMFAAHGRVRLLFDMSDFHGWSLAAMWADLKFGLKHSHDIERLAMVGDRAWERWMANICKPFVSAQVRYFDRSDIEEARTWIVQGLPAETPQPVH